MEKMTDEQKANFCDNYCKHLAKSNNKLKAVKTILKFQKYLAFKAVEEEKMAEICEKCPLNEV